MTATARPNLGGLFNGSTPPERSNGIADAVGPRRIQLAPAADEADTRPTEQAPETESAHITPDVPDVDDQPSDGEPRWAPLDWIDPVKAVEHYFAFLQALLDANRELAVAMAVAVRSLPRRTGLRR
jgi:hypothetical protein